MNPDELLSLMDFEINKLDRNEYRVRIEFSQSSPVKVLWIGDEQIGLVLVPMCDIVIDIEKFDARIAIFNMEIEYLPLLYRAINFVKTVVADVDYEAVETLLNQAIELNDQRNRHGRSNRVMFEVLI